MHFLMCFLQKSCINCKFPWPTPHAADPSLCSMSFLGTRWHDVISIGSLVLCHWRNVTWHCIIHKQSIPESSILGSFCVHLGALGHVGATLRSQKVKAYIPSLHFKRFCLQMGTPSGAQKSHLGPPGGRASELPMVCFGRIFSGPIFYSEFGTQN